MKIEFANTIPLRKILFKMDFNPIKETSTNLEYRSPFSTEKHTRLLVDIGANTWFDEVLLLGGGPVLLVCEYLKSRDEGHTQEDGLRWIKNMMNSPPKLATEFYPDYSDEDAAFRVRSILPLRHHLLLEYLDKRRIPRNIAALHLKEVKVVDKKTKKVFRALGLENIDGGIAIRSQRRKANVGGGTISFIRGTVAKPPNINIFKDFFDFLSVLAHNKGKPFADDCIVLNGHKHINDAIPFFRNYGYETAFTWFENTAHGIHLTQALTPLLKSACEIKHLPMNALYAGHRDANAWLMKQ